MNRIKRKRTLIGLCGFAILLFLVIGYAAYTEQLKLRANYNVTENFSVKITNIETTSLGAHAINVEAPTYTDTTATFNTKLYLPGDYAEYTVTVVNSGNIDAYLKSIDPDPNASAESDSAIKFSISGIQTGQSLKAESTVQFKVRIDYDINVTEQPTDLNASYDLTLFYEQGEGTIDPGDVVVPPTGNTAADILRAKAGASDGLYEDSYEAGRYIYKGANPKNNIRFDDDIWKIVSVESNGMIKIKATNVLGNMAFDSYTSSQNHWKNPSTLNNFLNNDYYKTMDSVSQSKIADHNFNVGPVIENNTDLSAQIASEKSVTWNGKIGLLSASDYIKANTNTGQCGTFKLHTDNAATCKSTNYLVPSGNAWTMNPFSDIDGINGYRVITMASNGALSNDEVDSQIHIYPAVYLLDSVSLTGSGTGTNPYVIS